MSLETKPPGAEPVPPGHRSGFIAIVGRPNTGKSTLLNRILGRKIAIVTPKPQTTRRRLLGIKTLPAAQIIFVDTPGIHHARDLMNERMVQAAKRSLQDADGVAWLIDAEAGIGAIDHEIAGLLPGDRPCVVVLNKIDRVRKEALLPLMERVARLVPGREIVPLSALTGENVAVLLGAIEALLPEGPRYYPAEEITDEPERAIVAEIVREKVMLETRQEVPYSVAVTIDSFEEKPEKRLVVIKATVHVARDSQKPILLGEGGRTIREIGRRARLEIEELLGVRVYLELFVRVQAEWTKNVGRLKEFGL